MLLISQSRSHKIEFDYHFDCQICQRQLIESDNKVDNSFKMSIEKCPDEIVLTIMAKLNSEQIYQFGCCAKKFFQLSQSNDLWRYKVNNDFPLLQPTNLQENEVYYHWHSRLECNLKLLDQILEASIYVIPEGLLKYIHDAIKEVGPQTRFNIQPVLDKLSESPYNLDIDFNLYLKDAIVDSFC